MPSLALGHHWPAAPHPALSGLRQYVSAGLQPQPPGAGGPDQPNMPKRAPRPGLGEDGVRSLNVSLSCPVTRTGSVGLALRWDRSHRPPGVAEAEGPDNLWAEGNLGPVLSEMDRTGGATELHTTSPAAALSLGVSGVWCAWLGAWNLSFSKAARLRGSSWVFGFHSCSALSLLLTVGKHEEWKHTAVSVTVHFPGILLCSPQVTRNRWSHILGSEKQEYL